MSKPIYTLRREWNDELADEVFTLEVEEDFHFSGDSFGTKLEKRDVASGDREWASRQAEHYGIKFDGLE